MGGIVTFLASDDAAYITGQILYVDGGITIQLGTRDTPL
jgi:enoyl-[acyl-carrier-protein] reductase (NADH)